MNIASKSGGTSLADAAQIRKSAGIIGGDPQPRSVVVSAPGKRRKKDRKVTDLLYSSWSPARRGDLFGAAETYTLVRKRFVDAADATRSR